jgi:hypothetical protein
MGLGVFRMKKFGGWAALACSLVIGMGTMAFGQAGQGNPPSAAAAQGGGQSTARPDAAQDQDKDKNAGDGLVIEPTELPTTYPHGPYQVLFHARGNYVPTLHWSIEKGALPPGITLDENGVLRGEAQRAGEFQFTVAVRDGGKPQQAVQRGYVIKVVEAMTVAWKVPAHVSGSRIEGSVEISNTTVDDLDLTFDVKAVAENGRATEIGYQHFPLHKGTVAMALPFGENLPHGGYVVYVNVVGEVAKRNAIYRERMQTPGALQVVVGP